MRNISFFLTQDAIRKQTKTVTRRQGWLFLTPGTKLQPVEKGQGLRKGEKIKKLGPPILVKKVTRERLDTITMGDIQKEGLPMSPSEFILFYAEKNKCLTDSIVTRIEFEYLTDE